MENLIVKRINVKILVLTITMVIISGVALILKDYSTTVIVLIAAALIFFFKRKHEVYTVTGSPVKRESYFFDRESKSALESVLHGELGDNSLVMYFSDNGSGRLDVIMTKDENYAVATIFHYIPHRYEQDSDPIEYTGPKVKKLARYLKRCQR
ncbi:MAG: hypothetical protein CVU12_00530 [Bacteroidetes bacterium HGW-Bacteroidetes-7]|jgi:hypothetical protein|nr:MAG: hypothetical protein CVU12_00530 [Bacteroidetes bacterium HGW-Bacteroidetes-7]